MRFIIIVTLLLSAQSQAENCAQLVSTNGVVDVLRHQGGAEDERQTLKYTMPLDLLCSDVVVTRQASRAKLKLPSTIMTLSPNSRVFVSQIAGKKADSSVVNLTYGKMRSFFKGEKKDGDKSTG